MAKSDEAILTMLMAQKGVDLKNSKDKKICK